MAIDNKTIGQFGEQWTVYNDTKGYFGSVDLFEDFIVPFDIEKIKGKVCADIGAGTGRFTDSILKCGAQKVFAVEPSKASAVIPTKISKKDYDKVEILNISGDKFNKKEEVDYAFSIGVLHHIPCVDDVVKAVASSLKPGGQFVVWLYGKEGNRLYLSFALPLRAVVKHLPLPMKSVVAFLLNILLTPYVFFCKAFPFLPLPMKKYMISVLAKCTWNKRQLVIYDQLNPNYAKYYTKKEAENLLVRAGLETSIFHRHNYSWVVIGTKK